MSLSLKKIADFLKAEFHGDGETEIFSISALDDAESGDIAFINDKKYLADLKESDASAIILTQALLDESSIPSIVVDNPRAAYAKIVHLFYPQHSVNSFIHPSATIDESAKIADSVYIDANVTIGANVHLDEHVYIGAGSVVGENSRIGRDTRLHANVSVYHDCIIGERCIFHSASVIGSDGFGFENENGKWLKIPQVGGVIVGNDVELGACSVIDRGALKNTIVEDGVKLDNHVQIAHNVHLGENTIMSRGVGVAGSTSIGKNCIFGGMTGVKDHIEIADNVIVTAMSLVSKSLTKPGSYSSNTPIDETRNWRKNSARFRQLDEMARRIKQLEKQIQNKTEE